MQEAEATRRAIWLAPDRESLPNASTMLTSITIKMTKGITESHKGGFFLISYMFLLLFMMDKNDNLCLCLRCEARGQTLLKKVLMIL